MSQDPTKPLIYFNGDNESNGVAKKGEASVKQGFGPLKGADPGFHGRMEHKPVELRPEKDLSADVPKVTQDSGSNFHLTKVNIKKSPIYSPNRMTPKAIPGEISSSLREYPNSLRHTAPPDRNDGPVGMPVSQTPRSTLQADSLRSLPKSEPNRAAQSAKKPKSDPQDPPGLASQHSSFTAPEKTTEIAEGTVRATKNAGDGEKEKISSATGPVTRKRSPQTTKEHSSPSSGSESSQSNGSMTLRTRSKSPKNDQNPDDAKRKNSPPVGKRATNSKSNQANAKRKKSPPTIQHEGPPAKRRQQDPKSSQPPLKRTSFPSFDVIGKYVKLPSHVPRTSRRVLRLTDYEREELEGALMLDDPSEEGNRWHEDWMGNLSLAYKEVPNPTVMSKSKSGAAKLPFWEWATGSTVGAHCARLLRNLFVHVYHMDGTPIRAKQILADVLKNQLEDPVNLVHTVNRLCYDPVVLSQDGWTTEKSEEPRGASGGPYHIGRHLVWEKSESVVIAYVHDPDIGDMWKCLVLEDHETFDLEAEELHKAMKTFDRRTSQTKGTAKKKKPEKTPAPSSSKRFAGTSNFMVDGVEHGIVLAASYHPHARMGLLWPARIMHVSEIKATTVQNKRSSSKNKVQCVFLAPYWNGRAVNDHYKQSQQKKNQYNSGELLEVDLVEVSPDTIHKYPYEGDELKINQLRDAFKFSGLPKLAFTRFVDSHRLALALKNYASRCLKKGPPVQDTKAMSTLTDTHSMSILAPIFPSAVLHLPFEYTLGNMACPNDEGSFDTDLSGNTVEPALQLQSMLDAMKPPLCWGQSVDEHGDFMSTPTGKSKRAPLSPSHSFASPQPVETCKRFTEDSAWTLDNFFVHDFLERVVHDNKAISPFAHLERDLLQTLGVIREDLDKTVDPSQRSEKLRDLLRLLVMTKGHGDDMIGRGNEGRKSSRNDLLEWRKGCERIYKRALNVFSSREGVTFVLTDSKCNEHITTSGCVERPIRIPAALKGARMASTRVGPNRIQIVSRVEENYVVAAEKRVLGKAHKLSYLKRMKNRCIDLAPDARGVPLTDDSDGNGGEDTMGSRGTYGAAVAGVALALQAVDSIVDGQCSNAFCASRPPGHHAGRDLHPMRAVSNGFCVFNPAACAALYATTPQSEGGPGLRRVCVIDFDVHHGNGTQDILCSTYDPRFLYVSLHAGGAHINGYDTEEEEGPSSTYLPGSTQRNGIYPGRCGDTSPHDGVLNIPLGARVTAHDVGTMLVTRVSEAVGKFQPDLVVLSAGFDAHKNDPLGMGGLSAQDFESITDVVCSMAQRFCSGRVLSILEGGYGVPCCRPQTDLFLPPGESPEGPQQPKLYDLGEDLPAGMEDQLPAGLRKRVDKCHQEGFVDCVKAHVTSLAEHNSPNAPVQPAI